MPKITVRVDLDDVLNKFSEYFVNFHYERTGEQLEFVSWNLHEYSRYGLDLWNHLEDPNFFIDAPVELNAPKLIDFLNNQSSVYEYMIVSSYYGDSKKVFENTYRQKQAWLYKNFGEKASKRLILVRGSKKEYPADIIIDDYYINLEEASDHSLKLFYRRDHNRKIILEDPNVISVENHNDIIKILTDMLFYSDISSYTKSTEKERVNFPCTEIKDYLESMND